jgi:rubrerythrin
MFKIGLAMIENEELKYKCAVCGGTHYDTYDNIVKNEKTCVICRTLGDKAYVEKEEREKAIKQKRFHEFKKKQTIEFLNPSKPTNLRRERPNKGKKRKKKNQGNPIFMCTNDECGVTTSYQTWNKVCSTCGTGRLIFTKHEKSN